MSIVTVRELRAPYSYVASEDAIRDVDKLILDAEGTTSVTWSLVRGPRQHSILELRGLGKEVWRGVDPSQYVNELRDEWNDR